MLQRGWPVLPLTIQLGKRMVTGRRPRLIPAGFVEGVVGGGVPPQKPQAQTQVVNRLAVVRVGIPPRQSRDGSPEMPLCDRKFPAPEVPQAKRIVAARVSRVSSQCLPPVNSRA